MNRFIVSILKNNALYDAFVCADDERTEEEFKAQAEKTYPRELGYQVIFLNRPLNTRVGESVKN